MNRNSANFELSHYYYSHKSSAVLENANLANERNYSGASEGTQPFRRQVSVPKRGESIRRRLLFETCANTVERDELDHHRVLNFSGKPNENSASSRLDLTRVAASKTQQRKIALENEVALDAPRVMDDFCTSDRSSKSLHRLSAARNRPFLSNLRSQPDGLVGQGKDSCWSAR